MFLSSLIFSALCCFLLIKFGARSQATDRCSHQGCVPTGGGIAVFLSFFIFSLFVYKKVPLSDSQFFFYSLCSLILVVMGFWDDLYGLSYRFRLFVQFLCCLTVTSAGFLIEFPGCPWIPIWGQKIFTIFALISLINGANFIDGLNGLLSGSLVVSLSFCLVYFSPLAPFLKIFLGSLLGFFFFNFPKGRIFIGDSGSTFLGFTLGCLAILAQEYYPLDTSTAFIHKGFIFFLTPLAFLGFDVFFTLFHRSLRKCSLTQPHREHMIHILNDAGYSHTVVSSLYFLTVFLMGILTYFCFYQHFSFALFFVIYIFFQWLFVFFAWKLRKFS